MTSVEKPLNKRVLESSLNLTKNKPTWDIKQYRIVECIGRGNFGDVYKAFDLIERRNVAIKAINLEYSDDEIPVLLQEINLLRSLKHQNITNWYNTFVTDISMFIVMEYCSEGSCADLLRFNKKGLTEVPLAHIMKSVLKGLSYLHESNIIHRDIKAANILINNEAVIKLADFGVSGQMENGSGRKTFVGTPYWMAPEIVTDKKGLKKDREKLERRLADYGLGKHTLYKIWKKKMYNDEIKSREVKDKTKDEIYKASQSTDIDDVEYDEKVDIWSLGITLIELSTGNVPNSEKEPLKALFDIPKREPPCVPKNSTYYLKEFCLACMCKDPVIRLSAKELLQLRFITKNKPKPGELDMLTGHGSKLKRRKPKFELNFDTFHYGPNVNWNLQDTIKDAIKNNTHNESDISSGKNSINDHEASVDENCKNGVIELQSPSTEEDLDMFSKNLLPPSDQYRQTAETSPIHHEQHVLHQHLSKEETPQPNPCNNPRFTPLADRVANAVQEAGAQVAHRCDKSQFEVLEVFEATCTALVRLVQIDASAFLALTERLSTEFVK